jgi:hypothetical protein
LKIPEGISKTEEAKLKTYAKNYGFGEYSILILNKGEWFLHPFPELRPVLIKKCHDYDSEDFEASILLAKDGR